MEASEALAGGEQTAPGGEQGATEAPAGPDLSPVLDRFAQLDQHFETFADRLDQIDSRFDGQGQQENGGEPQLYYDEQSGQFFDAPQGGNVVDPQTLGQQEQGPDPRFMGALQQHMQQQLAPMMQEINALREDAQDRQAADLEARYPAFQEAEYADRIVTEAEQRAQRYGNPELARNADFIELLHLAEVGRQRAAGQETPAGASETGVALETGGVTSPGGEQGSVESRLDAAIAARNQASSVWD
jgi:hypothetical protein